MKPRVYIETSVVSYLTARPSRDLIKAARQRLTREWWDTEREKFDLCTSQFVLDEAAAGDPAAARDRLAALAALPLLNAAAAGPVAERLLTTAALPAKARFDAYHLAVVAVNGVDYLCTGNCKHLANGTMRRRIEAACRDLGVEPPIICTPEELHEVKP